MRTMFHEYKYVTEIVDCTKQRIDAMILQHCKVLFVRLDLRFPGGTVHQGPNTEISQFMKALKSYYSDQGIAVHYVWAREQWSSDAPHYHVVLLLNGSRIQHPMGVWAKAGEIWSRITHGSPALVHECRQDPMGLSGNGSIMLRRPSGVAVGHDLLEQQQAFQAAYAASLEWGSYLAKDFSKGSASFRVREYGASRW